MKVKNVIRGLMKEYVLKEINIITDDRVAFSGNYENWATPDLSMILYKKEIENSEVKKRMIHNNSKAFIFI